MAYAKAVFPSKIGPVTVVGNAATLVTLRLPRGLCLLRVLLRISIFQLVVPIFLLRVSLFLLVVLVLELRAFFFVILVLILLLRLSLPVWRSCLPALQASLFAPLSRPGQAWLSVLPAGRAAPARTRELRWSKIRLLC
jgi:hypothetical protein